MNPEDTLDNLIAELKAGKKVSGITRMRSTETDTETFVPLLEALATLPKASLSAPYKEHRYAQALKPKSLLGAIGFFLRTAMIPLSVVAGLTLFISTGYAAQNSKPGQNLFFVKKSIEQTSLIFTPEAAKPQARLALTEKRLTEAEEVLANPNQDPETAKAALEELNQQAQHTFSDVRKVADTQDLSPSEVGILSSLAEITKKQEVLASTIESTSDQIEEIKKNATKDAQNSNDNIIKLIATVNERALADLKDPNEITISGGTVTSIDKTKIIVERTTFIIDQKNIIVLMDDQPFDLTQLKAKAKVSVIGTKTGTSITAKKIIILELVEAPAVGTVKGETTTTPATTPSPTTTTTTTPTTPSADTNNTEGTQPAEPAPNTITGTFIPEQP